MVRTKIMLLFFLTTVSVQKNSLPMEQQNNHSFYETPCTQQSPSTFYTPEFAHASSLVYSRATHAEFFGFIPELVPFFIQTPSVSVVRTIATKVVGDHLRP